MDTVILIPAYKPDSSLINVILPLHKMGFDILVVNDGSPAEYDGIFKEASDYAAVIGYPKNLGKGSALRFGISYIKENLSDRQFFITADADGQHTTDDIIRVNDSLHRNGSIVLGVRQFQGKIPLRSRIGNDMSRFAFAAASGKYLPDNQCGLRGFETSLCGWLLTISGKKYDYEINVLMRAASEGVRITELPVKTVYISGNKSSHFRPVADTLLIHKRIWTAAWISAASAAAGIAAMFLIWGYLCRHEFGAELSLLGSFGAGSLIGLALIFTFIPTVFAHISKCAGSFLLRCVFLSVTSFIITEAIYRASDIPLPCAYVISGAIAVTAEYFIRRWTHGISAILKNTAQKESLNEKI